MDSCPQFSVLIPSYNRPELIGAAVASVLANDFTDFEVIISDDRSPRQAEVAAVLAPFLADPRVHMHLQTQNLREAANREFLFSQARGEWQIVLCDDDKLHPRALRTLATVIPLHPDTDLFTFGYTVINEHDRVAYSRRAPAPLRVAADTPRLLRELLVSDSFPFWYYHPATFCSRRSVRERVKPNPNVGIGDDLMFLIDYVNVGGVIRVVPEVLMSYRKMSAGANLQQNQSAGDLANLVSRAKILLHLTGRTDLRPELASVVHAPGFRERLLFDPLIWSGVTVDELRTALALPDALVHDLAEYVRGHARHWHRWRLQSRRVTLFLSLFGLAGFRELASVQLQRSRHAA